ncbi:MAG: DUF2520 domain-containing protein [Bdellovibrionales bacterium]|nr:DUF2520 domain-containing protein [Bdellovibrionales bacterium]
MKVKLDSGFLYGLVGDGRVAQHLKTYFSLLKIPYQQWSRRSSEPLESSLLSCSHILLAISDQAIRTFYEEHEFLKQKRVIHFSGALYFNKIYGAHPLFAFTEESYDLETYRKIPFVVDKTEDNFKEWLPGFENPYWAISATDKSFYHSLCVISGNFTSMLWKDVITHFEQNLKLPREVLFPYMNQVFKNLIANSELALTGPLVRNDDFTIQKNLEALQGNPLFDIYQAFTKYYPVAHRSPHEHL